ncbi:MAG: SIS domain-containing protein [Fidelibacterota bacterium]
MEYLTSGKKVIQKEILALAELEKSLGKDFSQAADTIANATGKVIFLGLGKSGHVARKCAATFSSLGIPSFFMHACDAGHGDLGMITKEDVCVLISYSGKSKELLELIPPIEHIGAKMMTITGNPDSPLSNISQIHLDIGVRSEADPMGLAPTSSSTATLVLGDALAISIMEKKGFKEEDFAIRHPGGNLGKKLLLTLDKIIHNQKNIPLVYKDTSIQEALLTMSEKGFGMTGVINDDDELIGIITDGDIRRGIERGGENIFSKTAEFLMSKSPKKIPSNTLAIKALELMEEYSITSLFVTEPENPNTLFGVIHIHDILKIGL